VGFGEQPGKAFEVPAVGLRFEGGFLGAKVVGGPEAVESVDCRREVTVLGEDGPDLRDRAWGQMGYLASYPLERERGLWEQLGGLPPACKDEHGGAGEQTAFWTNC
jgi:hypothetical protein